jgi:hypothetical protein
MSKASDRRRAFALLASLSASLVIVVASGVGAQAPDRPARPADSGRPRTPEQDLRALQGKWEQQASPGQKTRVVKEVSGNRETLTTYEEGRVVYAHAVEFRLEREGGVRVFTFFNREVTAGPSKGQKFPEPSSYIYRVRGDIWDECWGFLPGHEDRDVLVKKWKRQREPAAQPAAARDGQ